MNLWLDPAGIAKAFDDDEARDERGRWTGGGGGGGGTKNPQRLRPRGYRPTVVKPSSRPKEDDSNSAFSAMDMVTRAAIGNEWRVVNPVAPGSGPPWWGMGKAFNADEARDKYGKWTAGDALHSSDTAKMHEAVGKTLMPISDQLDKVNEAHDALDSAVSDAKDAEEEADKAQKELGHEDPEFEQEALDAQNAAALSAVELHKELSTLHRMSGAAADDLETKLNDLGIHRRVGKSFNPDEARDSHGRWATGSDVPHPDYLASNEGEELYNHVEDVQSRLNDHLFEKVNKANEKLFDASSKHEDVENDEPDREEVGDKEYDAWQSKNNNSASKVVDAALNVRQALVDHAQKVAEEIRNLDEKLQEHEDNYGRREGVEKAFNSDQARDAIGRWTSGGGSPTHPDRVSGEVGYEIGDHFTEDGHDALTKSLDKVYFAGDALRDKADPVKDHAEEEPDYEDYKDEETGEHDDEQYDEDYAKWENGHDDAMRGVADSVMGVRQALADHVKMASDKLAELDAKIESEADGDARVGKNLTVGDVHAATALGNQPQKRKSRGLSTVGEIAGGGRTVELPTLEDENTSDDGDDGGDDAGDSMDKAAATALAHLIRHGATDMNNHSDDSKDRIRAWLDPDLNEDGRKDAEKAAKKAGKAGIQVVVSSDLKRAANTAKAVGKAVGAVPITTPKLRPWDLGDFTGKPSKDAYPQIIPYVTEKPDEPVPGGESFNDFRARAMQGLKFAVDKAGGKPLGVVTHYRNLRLYGAWDEAGQPADHSIDHDEFNKKGGPPGELVEMEINLNRLAGNKGAAVAKTHGWEEWRAAYGVDNKSSARDLEGAGHAAHENGMDRASTHAAGEQMGLSPDKHASLMAGWDHAHDLASKEMTKAALDGDVERFLELFAKQDAGSSINASLQLQPLDDKWAKSPFPWDQSALSYVQPEEMKPFLGALTDPEKLPVKTVRMNNVVALQDRVDPERVQSMAQNEPDALPVVVQLNGRKIIVDGHHRMTARWLNGRKTAQVRYLDLNPKDANKVAFEEELTATSDGGGPAA